MHNFKKPAAWLAMISALAVLLLSICLQTNPEQRLKPKPMLPGTAALLFLQKGTSHEVVLKTMGEPDFSLHGLHGEGYLLENGSAVMFYYGANKLVYEIRRSDTLLKPLGNAGDQGSAK